MAHRSGAEHHGEARRRPDGGWSAEREVSLASGRACCKALEEQGYRVTPIDVQPDIATVLQAAAPGRRLQRAPRPGRRGRHDPGPAGAPAASPTPIPASSPRRSPCRRTRPRSSWRRPACRCPEGMVVNRFEAAQEPRPAGALRGQAGQRGLLGRASSSCARTAPIRRRNSPREDWAFGEQVLVESYVAGRELTCAVMGDRALGVIDIRPATGVFYDYDAKYAKGGSIHVLPAEIKPNIYQKVQELALTAHQALGCRGVSRADFRYDDTPGEPGNSSSWRSTRNPA